MSHAIDILRITAAINKYLDTTFSGTIHFQGTEGPGSDTLWIEPWVSVTMPTGRSDDWLYDVALSINLFQKRTLSTYTISAIAGELGEMFKAHRLSIQTYDDLPLREVGVVSFNEPEVRDLGEVQIRTGARIGLRQFTFQVSGQVYPMAE